MRQRGRPKHPDILTPREWEVLALVREGLSNDAIGERLGISLDGVKFHVSEILGRLGVDNRQEAARWQPGGRPWWMAAVTPFLFWRKLGFGWLAPAVTGGVAIAAVVGVGLLIWGLTRTQAGTEPANAGEYALAQTFLNPEPAESDYAGHSVAAVGDDVLVGVYQDDASALDAGIAYLFDGGDGSLLQTFLNPNPASNAQFGYSVASVGDDVVVGARFATSGGTNAGAAYLFDGGTGTLLQTFVKPDPVFGDRFGESVASVGGNVLIGAPHSPTCSPASICGDFTDGAAYLFDGATGVLLRTFVSPAPFGVRNFGTSVADVGGNVLVGAPKEVPFPVIGGLRDDVLSDPVPDDTGMSEVGAAYLFGVESGVLLQTFLNPDAAVDDMFGKSVAAVGGNVLVSAQIDSQTAPGETGAVYLFDGDSGILLQAFYSPTSALDDQFGESVAGVSGNVLVGAPDDDTVGGNAGAAYLFDGDSGALLHTFLSPTPSSGDFFGWSVGGMGGNIVVSAPQDDAGADRAGAAYLFILQQSNGDTDGAP